MSFFTVPNSQLSVCRRDEAEDYGSCFPGKRRGEACSLDHSTLSAGTRTQARQEGEKEHGPRHIVFRVCWLSIGPDHSRSNKSSARSSPLIGEKTVWFPDEG